jgi:hypothetical protein
LEILGYILKSYSDFLKLEIGEIEIWLRRISFNLLN